MVDMGNSLCGESPFKQMNNPHKMTRLGCLLKGIKYVLQNTTWVFIKFKKDWA